MSGINRIPKPRLSLTLQEFKMSILGKIKTKQLAARKEKSTLAAALLTTLIGEAEMVGKNAGREVTDLEVIAVIKKFIKNTDETIGYCTANQNTAGLDAAMAEKEILTALVPAQLSDDELAAAINKIINDMQLQPETLPQMGAVMGALKLAHPGLYDGRKASEIIKSIIM